MWRFSGVGDDLEQRVARLREQGTAGRQIQVALFADRVDGAIALARIVGIEKQGVGRLVAFEVEYAHSATGLQARYVVVAGADGTAAERIPGLQFTGLEHIGLPHRPRW